MIARAKSSLLLVGLLLVLLPVLAVLQYRWIGEVSAAERSRLENSLRIASDQFATDFESEFSRLANAFQIREGFPETADIIAERYQLWSEGNPYTRLVRTIYALKAIPNNESEFYKVDLAGRQFEPATLPRDWEMIREPFRRGPFNYSANDMTLLVAPVLRPGRPFPGPRPDEFRPRPPDDYRRRGERFGRGRGADQGFPPPLPPTDRGTGPGPGGPPGGPVDGAVIIELDRDAILKEFVPALTARHFSSHDETAYRIAVVTQDDRHRVLYSSSGEWTAEDVATPDAAVNLFGPARPAGSGGRGRGSGRGPQSSVIGEPWQLLVKHRSGSLESAVEHVRVRNLAISFGIILVLGAGLITLVISSQRAHTLGKLQMEFAAGVSHELRTPLAVIRSAAHNLRSGIVHDKEGVEQYAAIVQEEARRLSDMVEEVLLYAETQSGRKKYKLEPTDVNEVIERAITNISPSIDFTECEWSTYIDADLPPLKADAAALTQCVQNLLSNAVKYGRRDGKVTIDIAASKETKTNEILLSVTDHGPGIDSVDQRQLFEPFYRGHNVESNIPGNGLGLHLVQRIMQAQGGRVTFSAAPDGGARFTLHIPSAS